MKLTLTESELISIETALALTKNDPVLLERIKEARRRAQGFKEVAHES
jgi:hypothetical protein